MSLVSLAVVVALVVIATTALTPHAPITTDVNTVAPEARDQTASLSLIAPISGTFDAGETQTIRWSSENYRSSHVSINLIRKISDDPQAFELVRVIAEETPNDGSATWVPAPTDVGTNLSIEIGCVRSTQACTGSQPTSNLAVTNTGRFEHTANIFQAIEQRENR